MVKNMYQIISKIFFILVFSGWVGSLYSDCSENEIKEIVSKKVLEFRGI